TTAKLVAREAGIAAGVAIACGAFALLGDDIDVNIFVEDGRSFAAGQTLAEISGDARAILSGERTALNLLSRLCGIATVTHRLVMAIAGTRAHVVCTRKTTPGLRVLEKYAVRCGGGSNHRFGLDDAVLVKDNHIALAGSIAEAIARVHANVGHMVKIEVEVDSLDQLREILDQRIDAVLLDNMDVATLREAVSMVGGRMLTEASGGVTAERILAIAQTGVDLISVGRITHGAASIDIGLDIGS
ncbi:MAG: carboxylating nicotinate-nucleotide diphosphorylase, partial [Vulcanimicrobiaceae bacterium]